MLITPRPGAQRDTILNDLAYIRTQASNLRGGIGPYNTAGDWLLSYLEWATDAVQRLRYSVSDADIDRLILTRRYYALLDGAGRFTGNNQARLVNGLIGLEFAERVDALEAAMTALKDIANRWARPGASRWFVVADPSFYIQHTAPLADADLHAVLGLPQDEEIHLLFPIVVVDELDGLKEAGKARPRWRSLHTLGLLGSVLREDGTGTLFPAGTSQPGTDSIRGAVTVEIVFDQPGHVRLPIADDEIIDRALAIQHLAGRDVHLLTGDTGQSTRGHAVGLKVHQIPAEDPGDEPDWAALRAAQDRAGTGTRAKRRARQQAEADAAAEDRGAPPSEE